MRTQETEAIQGQERSMKRLGRGSYRSTVAMETRSIDNQLEKNKGRRHKGRDATGQCLPLALPSPPPLDRKGQGRGAQGQMGRAGRRSDTLSISRDLSFRLTAMLSPCGTLSHSV